MSFNLSDYMAPPKVWDNQRIRAERLMRPFTEMAGYQVTPEDCDFRTQMKIYLGEMTAAFLYPIELFTKITGIDALARLLTKQGFPSK